MRMNVIMPIMFIMIVNVIGVVEIDGSHIIIIVPVISRIIVVIAQIA